MGSPVAGVLDTYELLERILLNPSTKAIFGAQRVSPTWKDIIARSHPLQTKMFLMVDGGRLTPDRTCDSDVEYTAYVWSLRLNPMVELDLHLSTRLIGYLGYPRDGMTYRRVRKAWCHGGRAQVPRINIIWDAEQVNALQELAPNAIRKSMFLTQPSIQGLRPHLGSESACTIVNADGVTFRDAPEGL